MIVFAYYSTPCYLFYVVEANNDKKMLIREFWKEDLCIKEPAPSSLFRVSLLSGPVLVDPLHLHSRAQSHEETILTLG